MDRKTELAIIRRAFAKQIMAVFGADDRQVEQAFAAVPREAFRGNPVYLYDDVVVAILPERNLNNGQP